MFIATFLFLSFQLSGIFLLIRFKRKVNRTQRNLQAMISIQPIRAYPGISILTPMKGLGPDLEAAITSRLTQNYPGPVELILIVADETDPVIAEAQHIIERTHSNVEIQWCIGLQRLGLNPKNSNLAHGFRIARYNWIYCADADTTFGENHLLGLLHESEKNPLVFVTSLKVHKNPNTLAAALEAVSLNLELVNYFLMSELNRRGSFVNGASFFFHRELLKSAGGFESVLNTLTDDLVLEARFRDAGASARLLPELVFIPHETQSMDGYFSRQVRWQLIARCYKSWVIWATPFYWVPQWLIVFGVFTSQPMGVLLGLFLLTTRTAQSLFFQIALDTPRADWTKAFLLPLYDVLAPVIWLTSIFTRKISWAGHLMILGKNGSLKAAP